ncbi:MAG: hypothetical protein AAGF48_02900 [Pseudomonadota bacterium]
MANLIDPMYWESDNERTIRKIGGRNSKDDEWSIVAFGSDEDQNVVLRPIPTEYFKASIFGSVKDKLELTYAHLGGGDDTLISEAGEGKDGGVDDLDRLTNDYKEIFDGGDGDDYIQAYQLDFGHGASLLGGGGGDTLIGSQRDDTIYGDHETESVSQDEKWEGDAVLVPEVPGTNYNDAIYGGAGSDTIDAGFGDDYIDAGIRDGSSVDSITTGDGRDFVNLGSIAAGFANGEAIPSFREGFFGDAAEKYAQEMMKTFIKGGTSSAVHQNAMIALSVAGIGSLRDLVEGGGKVDDGFVATKDDYVHIVDFSIVDDRAFYATAVGLNGKIGSPTAGPDSVTDGMVITADANGSGTGGRLALIQYDEELVSDMIDLNARYLTNLDSDSGLTEVSMTADEIKAQMYEITDQTISSIERRGDDIYVNGVNLTSDLQLAPSVNSEDNNLYEFYKNTLADGQGAIMVGGARVLYGKSTKIDGMKLLMGSYESDMLYTASAGEIDALTNRGALYGFGGDDALFGSSGMDFLIGGSGQDLLTGYLGKDYFIFDTEGGTVVGADQRDTITDFTLGEDVIRLTGFGEIDSTHIQFFKGQNYTPDGTWNWDARDGEGENDPNKVDIVLRVRLENGAGYHDIALEDMLDANHTDAEYNDLQHIILSSI